MKRILFVCLFLLLVGGGGVWYMKHHTSPTSLAGKLLELASEQGMTSFDGSASTNGTNPLENMAGLAIKGINLFQGEKGLELWRLKATWAHMAQQGDTIDVDSPNVQYALGESSVSNPDDDKLNVQAQKGRITDNQRFLNLWDDVIVTRFDETLTSPRMEYDSKTRIMTFPQGASLDGPKASGTADHVTWQLASNELSAEGNVVVILKPRSTQDPSATTAIAPSASFSPNPENTHE